MVEGVYQGRKCPLRVATGPAVALASGSAVGVGKTHNGMDARQTSRHSTRSPFDGGSHG